MTGLVNSKVVGPWGATPPSLSLQPLPLQTRSAPSLLSPCSCQRFRLPIASPSQKHVFFFSRLPPSELCPLHDPHTARPAALRTVIHKWLSPSSSFLLFHSSLIPFSSYLSPFFTSLPSFIYLCGCGEQRQAHLPTQSCMLPCYPSPASHVEDSPNGKLTTYTRDMSKPC